MQEVPLRCKVLFILNNSTWNFIRIKFNVKKKKWKYKVQN